ncbi:hypothetical protein [Demequina sp.]|uniref:hypothetical protein n=1 Tax=Demequina sp. TaxID=2050685 RepID=UPI003D098EB8
MMATDATDTSRRRGRVPARLSAAQARAGLAANIVAVVIVAVAVLLTAAVPVLANSAATRQLRADVVTADRAADVVVTVPYEGGSGNFALAPDTADSARYVRDEVEEGMPRELTAVLEPPITTLVGPELKAGVVDGTPVRVRFAYVDHGETAAVDWVDGRPPAATGTAADVARTNQKLPVEVGVSESAATALGVTPGDRLPVQDLDGAPLEVTVTGVFAPHRGAEAAVDAIPTLLEPRESHGAEPQTSVALLTTDESVPAARLALFPGDMTRAIVYRTDVRAITAGNAEPASVAARGLASGKEVFDIVGASASVSTRLDTILDASLSRASTATAQASVLLICLVVLIALTQVLSARALVDQRASVIAQVRTRGASVVSVGLSLLAESAIVTALGAGLGLAAQAIAAPGRPTWWWVVPTLLMSLIAAPLLGARAAWQRRRPRSSHDLRRITREVLLVLAAIGSAATLRSRGTAASSNSVAADLLVLAAPTLCALAVGAGVARLMPTVSRWLRDAASRGSAAGTLVAFSRASATTTAVLALVLAAGTIALSASVASTVRDGRLDAAHDNVGADAIATATYLSGLPPEVAGLPVQGVTTASASDIGAGYLAGGPRSQTVTIVAVDAAALASVVAALPGGHPDPWRTLATAPEGEPIAMLETADLTHVDHGVITFARESAQVTSVGTAPDLPGAAIAGERLVIVDREALEAVTGESYPITAAWAVGPEAVTALTRAVGDADAEVVTRDEWIERVGSEPLAGALSWLFAATVVVALAFAVLAVALLATSGNAQRRHAMARLRVVGMSAARVSRVSRLEVLIPVALVSLFGVLGGIAVARLTIEALGLGAITRQAHAPQPEFAWWALAVPLLLAATAWVAVGLAVRFGRSRRLSEVMRTS